MQSLVQLVKLRRVYLLLLSHLKHVGLVSVSMVYSLCDPCPHWCFGKSDPGCPQLSRAGGGPARSAAARVPGRARPQRGEEGTRRCELAALATTKLKLGAALQNDAGERFSARTCALLLIETLPASNRGDSAEPGLCCRPEAVGRDPQVTLVWGGAGPLNQQCPRTQRARPNVNEFPQLKRARNLDIRDK